VPGGAKAATNLAALGPSARQGPWLFPFPTPTGPPHDQPHVHLKAAFVDGGVLLALPYAKAGVYFFQHPQHGAVYPGELGGEDDAFAGVPQQIDVTRGQCVSLKPHPAAAS
jgi:hypothetical protein